MTEGSCENCKGPTFQTRIGFARFCSEKCRATTYRKQRIKRAVEQYLKTNEIKYIRHLSIDTIMESGYQIEITKSVAA